MIKRIWGVFSEVLFILNRTQKITGFLVILGSIVGAILEMLGVSVIIPLVNALLAPAELMKNEWIQLFMNCFSLHSERQLILLVIAFVILLYLIKNAYCSLFSWIKLKYACRLQCDISVYMMNSYLCRGYSYVVRHNVSELRQGIEEDSLNLYEMILAIIQCLSQFAIIVLICVYMCITDIIIALGVIVTAAFCLGVIYFVFRKKIYLYGEEMRKESIESNRIFLDTFQGIKEVVAMRKQRFFSTSYQESIRKKQNAKAKRMLFLEIPAYIVEGVCISGIMVVLCIRMLSVSDSVAFVATLASFAVGAFRVLPALGKISAAINQMIPTIPNVHAIFENISEARKLSNTGVDNFGENIIDTCDRFGFSKKISVEGLMFSYEDSSEPVLRNINFDIEKGKAVAIVGESGAGKSTLADLVLGVIVPNKGAVYMDGTDIREIPNMWSNVIGFVPQTIHLSDASIARNVAYGIPQEEIEEDRVRTALGKANLLHYIDTLPDGINTEIGDRGVRLSGGQRQRIGIARALYRNPQILILDEATSALDNETENFVMEAIDALRGQMTMLVIAHRLTTIRNCDTIYEIKNGVNYERSYEELMTSS